MTLTSPGGSPGTGPPGRRRPSPPAGGGASRRRRSAESCRLLGEVRVAPGLPRARARRDAIVRCMKAAVPGSGATPTANIANEPGSLTRRRGGGALRPSAPPRWRSSTLTSGEPEPGPAAPRNASIAARELAREQRGPLVYGDRLRRVHVQLGEADRRHHRERVDRPGRGRAAARAARARRPRCRGRRPRRPRTTGRAAAPAAAGSAGTGAGARPR